MKKKITKICIVYGEGYLNDWTVKSSLQSFMPETCHRWVDEGRLIANTLLENNQRYTTQKLNTHPLKSISENH